MVYALPIRLKLSRNGGGAQRVHVICCWAGGWVWPGQTEAALVIMVTFRPADLVVKRNLFSTYCGFSPPKRFAAHVTIKYLNFNLLPKEVMWSANHYCGIKTLVMLTTTAVFMCFLISFLVCLPTWLQRSTNAGRFRFLTLLQDGFFVNICRSGSSYCGVSWAFRIVLRILTVWANVLKGKVYLRLELFLETLSLFPAFLHCVWGQHQYEVERWGRKRRNTSGLLWL